MEEVQIETDYIKLDQFLKYAGIAQTGGHATMLIKDGLVSVNEEVCTQRGKKLVVGDVIEVDGEETFTIV